MASPQDQTIEQKARAEAARDRRQFPRQLVDCEAVIFQVSGALKIPGKLSDLSPCGCLMLTEQRYEPGILVRVELQFQLQGIAFRIVGVIARTVGSRSLAVRFLDLPARRRIQLEEVLAEVLAEAASEPPPKLPCEPTGNSPAAGDPILPLAR